ncbi:MAG: DUF1080 domain-containing protein [Verrucomicrobia bacterium]|nr:DUF1080 domain-containing protein [Verrucomicrobiota bacterium]
MASHLTSLTLAAVLPLSGFMAAVEAAEPVTTADLSFAPHDPARPRPSRVEPLPAAALAERAQPPAGAIILFNGRGLDAWGDSTWKATDDYLEIVTTKGRPSLITRAGFGSCRLHLEWWSPPGLPPGKSGQSRSNSGVFLMGRYEVQVLDSLDGATYADGHAGAVYGQFPPSANALRPAGEWQYYDIEFRRPIFDAQGNLVRPARLTVEVNGVRVQNNVQLTGPTGWKKRPPYAAHADRLPLSLQDHGDVLRYRNIWLVPIAD